MAIIKDPHIQFGVPTIKGTRITVESIVEALKRGQTPEYLAKAMSVFGTTITKFDILEARDYDKKEN